MVPVMRYQLSVICYNYSEALSDPEMENRV